MKKSEFPEKLYEALILHELLEFVPKGATPPLCVPSQVVEQKTGCDLCFIDSACNPINRKVLMFQFKISCEYERKSKKGSFKFELYPKNTYEQHNKLCKYNLSGKQVAAIYCAPRFVTYKELLNKIISKNIIGDSIFFKPIQQISDNCYHYVEFDSINALQHSKESTCYDLINISSLFERIQPISKEEFLDFLMNSNNLSEESRNNSLCEGMYYLFV